MFTNTLSGRFLVLTILFVMLAEVFIFVPSIARFRQDYMINRLERAQIASLALLADDMIEPELEAELLKNAGVYNVVLRRDEVRQLVLTSDMPKPVDETFDLRDPPAGTLIMDAMARLLNPNPEVVRVIGTPAQDAGLLIEITMPTEPLRASMLDYGVRILILSAVISIFTATLLFFAVRFFLVKPIKGVVSAMKSYAAAPEDAINLGLGQPDLPTPASMALGGIAGIVGGRTGYTTTAGDPGLGQLQRATEKDQRAAQHHKPAAARKGDAARNGECPIGQQMLQFVPQSDRG